MKNELDTSAFFNAIFLNARNNAMIIMDLAGNILQVNEAFTRGFGYGPADVDGKNFDMLFTDRDRQKNKPKEELLKARQKGSMNDENYLLNKEGNPIWVTGECISVEKEGPPYFVKIIHNMDVSKQLERFLEEAEGFIDSLFDASSSDMGLLMLDPNLRVIKVNRAFMTLFSLSQAPLEGTTLGSLHPFWNNPAVKTCLRETITKNRPLKRRTMETSSEEGGPSRFMLDSKMVTDNSLSERRIIVVAQVAPTDPE